MNDDERQTRRIPSSPSGDDLGQTALATRRPWASWVTEDANDRPTMTCGHKESVRLTSLVTSSFLFSSSDGLQPNSDGLKPSNFLLHWV